MYQQVSVFFEKIAFCNLLKIRYEKRKLLIFSAAKRCPKIGLVTC